MIYSFFSDSFEDIKDNFRQQDLLNIFDYESLINLFVYQLPLAIIGIYYRIFIQLPLDALVFVIIRLPFYIMIQTPYNMVTYVFGRPGQDKLGKGDITYEKYVEKNKNFHEYYFKEYFPYMQKNFPELNLKENDGTNGMFFKKLIQSRSDQMDEDDCSLGKIESAGKMFSQMKGYILLIPKAHFDINFPEKSDGSSYEFSREISNISATSNNSVGNLQSITSSRSFSANNSNVVLKPKDLNKFIKYRRKYHDLRHLSNIQRQQGGRRTKHAPQNLNNLNHHNNAYKYERDANQISSKQFSNRHKQMMVSVCGYFWFATAGYSEGVLRLYADIDGEKSPHLINLRDYSVELSNFNPGEQDSKFAQKSAKPFSRSRPILLKPKAAHAEQPAFYLYAPTGIEKESWFFCLYRISEGVSDEIMMSAGWWTDMSGVGKMILESLKAQTRRYSDIVPNSDIDHDDKKDLKNKINRAGNILRNQLSSSSIAGTLAAGASVLTRGTFGKKALNVNISPIETSMTALINILLGRSWVNLKRTDDIKNWFQDRIGKKLEIMNAKNSSRFLNDIKIRKLDLGNSLPVLSNVNELKWSDYGDMSFLMDIDYSGEFRIELETEIKWDIMKVKIIIEVMVEQLCGTLLFKVHPMPSSRAWYGFTKTPIVNLKITPQLGDSNRSLNLNWIKDSMHDRIINSLEDVIVLPNMEDLEFSGSNLMEDLVKSNSHKRQSEAENSTDAPKIHDKTDRPLTAPPYHLDFKNSSQTKLEGKRPKSGVGSNKNQHYEASSPTRAFSPDDPGYSSESPLSRASGFEKSHGPFRKLSSPGSVPPGLSPNTYRKFLDFQESGFVSPISGNEGSDKKIPAFNLSIDKDQPLSGFRNKIFSLPNTGISGLGYLWRGPTENGDS